MSENTKTGHVVVVIGGAVSGSTLAELLANKGITVVLIEQNARPYGKIEDGLPRWHAKQRSKEYVKINNRLGHGNIHYVPNTQLGRDVTLAEIVDQWKPNLTILANGAWKDRPLGIPEAEEYIEKGMIYQNPFIYWFNHKEEKDYDGPHYDLPQGALIIGGGLASIDCVKVCQLEYYIQALREKKGIEVDAVDLEHKGIAKFLAEHEISKEELEVDDCWLLYRRRKVDMPTASPKDRSPEAKAKAEKVRAKVLDNVQKKFLFNFQDQRLTEGILVEEGRMVGLKMTNTVVDGRKATPVEGSEHEVRSGLVISSIGSIPEPIDGLDMNGAFYDFKDWDLGIYDESRGIWGVGNVVTGQGNIQKSAKHAKEVGNHLVENYLGISESGDRDISAGPAAAEAKGAETAERATEFVVSKDPLPEEARAKLMDRVRALQTAAGYTDFESWIEKVTPADLG